MSALVETLHAYVSLPLDLTAARRAVDIARALRPVLAGAGWGVAWQSPAALHVTVRNLGPLDVGLVGALGAALTAVAARHAPFRLHLDAPALRGDPGELCLPVADGHEALVRLILDVDVALEALGFARPPRPPSGRVGLGRVRSSGAGPLALPRLDGCASFATELRLHRLDGASPDAEPPLLHAAPLTLPRPPEGQGMSPRGR